MPVCDHMYSAMMREMPPPPPRYILSSSVSSFSSVKISLVFLFFLFCVRFLFFSIFCFFFLLLSSSFAIFTTVISSSVLAFLTHLVWCCRDTVHAPRLSKLTSLLVFFPFILAGEIKAETPFLVSFPRLQDGEKGTLVLPPPCCNVTGSHSSASRPGQLLVVVRQLGGVTLR